MEQQSSSLSQPSTSSTVLNSQGLPQGLPQGYVGTMPLVPHPESSDSDSDLDDITPPTIIKKKSELPRKPKSKYKGVFRCGKKFKAQIQTNGVQHYLGLYDIEEDAARAYDIHAKATFGSKAKTNFVYESGENIVPSDFVMVQGTSEHEDGNGKLKGPPGSHPRRTYVGIKARRKRMSEGDSRGDGNTAHTSDRLPISHGLNTTASSFAVPPRKKLRHSTMPLAGGSTAAATAADSTDGVGDWREQLYHWRGHLSIDSSSSAAPAASKTTDNPTSTTPAPPSAAATGTAGVTGDNAVVAPVSNGDSGNNSSGKNVLLWSGTWVGSWQQVAGSESTLAWTGNTFTYRGPPVAEANEGPSSMSVPLKPVSGSYMGHYMMDNEGSGRLSRYSDNACYLDFREDEAGSGKYSVIGRGDSDFGAFILQGRYDSASRALDITRKYIPDSDPRAGEKISLHELRASLARDPVKISSNVPVGMLGGKTLDVVGSVVSVNKEVEI